MQEGSDGGEGNVGGVGVDDGGGSGGGGDGDGGAGGVKAGDMGGVPSIDPSELTRVLSSAVLGGRVCLGRKRAAVLATAWPTCGALAAASAAELTAQCPPGFPLTLLQHVVGALRPLVRGYTGAEPMVVDNPAAVDEGTLETHANLATVHRLVRPACEKDSVLMKRAGGRWGQGSASS